MLIKLPIIKNDYIDIINFSITRFENKFLIKPIKSCTSDKFEIPITNKEFCMNKFTVNFPLEIMVIDKSQLFCKFFFVIALSNGFDCELNFFSNLLEHIKKTDKKLKFIDLNYIKSNVKNIVKKCNLRIENKKKFESFEDMKIYIDDQLNFSINFIYLLIYIYNDYTNKDFKNSDMGEFVPKKIISCFNIIKSFKLKFKGSENYSLVNHIENLKNDSKDAKNIKKDHYYFLKLKDSKVIKMKIINNLNDSVVSNDLRSIEKSSCKILNYNPKYDNHLNFNYFLKELLKYDYDLKLLISYKLFKKDDKDICNIINFIYKDNKNFIFLSSLRNLDYTFNNLDFEYYNKKDLNLEMKILEDGYINNEYMYFLTNKYKDDKDKKIEILRILFLKYNFPLTFNKKKLNDNFEMIMYFSLLNYEDLIKVVDVDKVYLENYILDLVPVKLKNLYFNLLKTYYQLANNSLENITYNFKYYQDYIYIYVVKNIIQDNTILTSLFKKHEMYYKLVNVYRKNFILNQLILELNWENISIKLSNLSYVFKNTDLIFYQNKLNRNLFPDSIDYKIKGIILDKFSMYKYLKQEKDFIKWTKFIKHYISELYEKSISMSNDDIISLGKLIFKLYELNSQDLKDKFYIDLIDFCQKNKKLILINNRINLMIKEKLPGLKCQLNLGYFAKHLNFNNIENKIEISEDKIVSDVKLELKTVTKKYYKYKGKYIKSKGINSSVTI